MNKIKKRALYSSLLTRSAILLIGLTLLWSALVWLLELPNFILPGPMEVLCSLWLNKALIWSNFIPTFIETLLGLILGSLLGISIALCMISIRLAEFWLKPILLISQALPTFAIAPLFVIWFGYGEASKVATAVLMIFFPIASNFFDGLKNTPQSYLDLAHTMNASQWRTLWYIRIPKALPQLATGLRIATAIAPIGAIVGEWVGASSGLGFLMLNSNARMQISLMFACLLIVILFSLILYSTIDHLLKRFIFWQKHI